MAFQLDDLNKLRDDALAELEEASKNSELLEVWRVKYLGRKGVVADLMRGITGVSSDQRAKYGKEANLVKKTLEQALLKTGETHGSAKVSDDFCKTDITLPGTPVRRGGLHPVSKVADEISSIFGDLGFLVVEGSEIESETYNFDMLNFPKQHPSRDAMDSIWVDLKKDRWLLRTHTSSMQIHTMQKNEPPIRHISPGKCYRNEATDPSHEWHFHQVEGIAIDKDVGFGQMKWTLESFVKALFGEKRKIRMRCDFFPFVEPGVDVSVDCFVCEGLGCRVCQDTGWIEILGAGMTHPNVLKNAGYDPDIYSGFAFGVGVERIAMLKYGIEDIRLFFENDLRFLEQF